tara:strand:+ start:183 stop:1763 length:1581 start_codon:yes stop_codon:yes gene_type:complete
MGPWFFPQYDSDDPIDLSTDDLTIIDKDGVVCFCEGRSEFSGLVTTSEVTLYGNGDVKDVIVSPKENYYFNLIAVTNEDLITFSTVYELKTLTNIDDKLVISIENITFTNNYNPPQKFPIFFDIWGDQELDELVKCLSNVDADDYLNSPERLECIEEFGELGASNSASIQVTRPKTNLSLNNVVFKEFANITNILEYGSNGNLEIQNTDIIDNQSKFGLLSLGAFDYLSISNLLIKNNDKSKIFIVSAPIGIRVPSYLDNPKININGLDVVDNRNLFVSIWSKFKFNGQSIHFRNNTWDLPFTLFTGDKTLFDINELSFINNTTSTSGIGFGIGISGSGTITESEIRDNNLFNAFMIRSKQTIFYKSVFENNKSRTPFLFYYVGNLRFVNSAFIDNKLPIAGSEGSENYQIPPSILLPRLLVEFSWNDHPFAFATDEAAPYADLAFHNLNLENVIFKNSEKHIASILSINNWNELGWLKDYFGGEFPSDLSRADELTQRDILSIYKFKKINYLNCGYDRGIYKCNR